MVYTDKYFEKTRNCVNRDDMASYGVFLRHDVICAITPALDFLRTNALEAEIRPLFPEGALVPAETPLFSYSGRLYHLVELETRLLQLVGFSCISAYNAYQMCLACRDVSFLDMHARHAAGPDMVLASAYGASVGSRSAKLQGAKGFIGSSLDWTAHFYDTSSGLGTMPHVLIGYAGSTLQAVKLFVEKNPNDRFIVALVDYYGREYDDALQVADWFKSNPSLQNHQLGIRLDTHGGRFAQDLDYDTSIDIMEKWLHTKGKWPIVRKVMGADAFDVADDSIRDRVAKILFGTGVSAANIVEMRNVLDMSGHHDVQIVASSGFNLRKCKIMANANAPIDIIGTGSFLPETLPETYATADCFAYNGKFSVKVGRESIFKGLDK